MANVTEIELKLVVGVSVGAYVDQVVVEQLRHAVDGSLNGNVSVQQRGTVCAVVQKAVEFVDVFHGHS